MPEVKQEHLHTRAQAGLFHVSHMGLPDRMTINKTSIYSTFPSFVALNTWKTHLTLSVLPHVSQDLLYDSRVFYAGNHLYLSVRAAMHALGDTSSAEPLARSSYEQLALDSAALYAG